MKQLLSKARSRVIGHLVLDKGALALTIGLGVFILLLLIGTQVLDWYWPVLIAAVSLGVGVYQLRKSLPSTYEVAQRIDHRLELADSLSTAYYFSEHPKPGFEAVCAAQYLAAEQLAAGVDLPQALPLPRSRYLLPAGALLLAAMGLFAVRYFMIGSLDLQSSLLEAVADTFFSAQPQEVAKNTQKQLKNGAFDPSRPATPETLQEDKELPPDAEKGQKLSEGKDQQQYSSGDEKGPGKSDEQNSDDQQGDQNSSPQDKQGDQGKEGKDQNESQSQGNDQRSLMDKLRDAMNNVMNKMTSNDSKQNAQKGGEKQKSQKQDKNGKGDQNNQSDDDAQADNNQDGNDGKQPDNKKAANAPGQKPSDQAASGNGENDGKKDIEQAKMLEAMGKLNELIGERSNQISGDMTVEVGSSTQQLKTAMTQQKAGHTDAGGEIHRDQVPLADQLFVEQYFKEVRKPGTSGTPPPADAAKGKAAATKK